MRGAFSISQLKKIKAIQCNKVSETLIVPLTPKYLRDAPGFQLPLEDKNSPRELYNDSFCKSDLKFLPFDTPQWTDPQTFLHSKMKNILGITIPHIHQLAHIKSHNTYLEQSVFVISIFLFSITSQNILKAHSRTLITFYV